MAASIVGTAAASSTNGLDFSLDISGLGAVSGDVVFIFSTTTFGETDPDIVGSSPTLTFHNILFQTGDPPLICYYTILTGSTAHFIDIAGSGNNGFATSAIAVIVRGLKTTSPAVGSNSQGGNNPTSPDPPSLTVSTGGDAFFFAAFTATSTNDSTPGAPSGYTEAKTGVVTGGVAGDITLSAAYKASVTALASDNPGTWSTLSTPGASWRAATIRFELQGATTQALTASLVSDTDAFFTQVVTSTYPLTATLLGSDDAFIAGHTLTIDGVLTPSLYAESDVFFASVIELLNRTLLPSLVADTDSFGVNFLDIVTPLVATIPIAHTGARTIILVEIDAVDEDGNPNTLRYATDGVMSVSEGGAPRAHYEPRLIDPGNFERIMFDPSTPFQGASSGSGDIQVTSAAGGRGGGTTDAVMSMGVDGRQFSVYEIESKRSPKSTWNLRLRGVVDYLITDDAYNKLGFRIRDALRPLEAPLLTDAYAGTTTGGGLGTADGDAPLLGVKKQNCYGYVFNVEGQPANPYDLVYQFSNRPCASITVRDAGLTLSNRGDFASFASFMAWTQVAGAYVTHLAQGMARLGSQPTGAVTADVVTETDNADMTAGQLVKQILDESFAFITSTTTSNLLTDSPDALAVVNATLTGAGPIKIVEAAVSGEHLARTQTIVKEARSVSYTFTGEFDFDPRGLLIRAANASDAFAGLVVPGDGDPTMATSTEEGGYSVVSFEVTQLDANWWEVVFAFSTNSATSFYIDLVLATTSVVEDRIVFDTIYTGSGTNGVKYRNLSLAARISVNTDLLDDLDAKNPGVCGLLVTGDQTILEACQLLLGGIGAWMLPNQFSELEFGRFDVPPAVPSNTNELIPAAADLFFTTTMASVVDLGGGEFLLKENAGTGLHVIGGAWPKAEQKIRYRFEGEFKPAGRDFLFIALGSATSAILEFDLADGSLTFRSGSTGLFNGRSTSLEFGSIEPSTAGYFRVVCEILSDEQNAVAVNIFLEPSHIFFTYTGNGSSGIQFRNLSFKPVNPSVALITEEIVIGDSLQRLPAGDQGRGIPYWSVTTKYEKNWRLQQSTEIVPAVDNASRARWGQEWLTTSVASSTDTRNTHPGSVELVTESYLVFAAESFQENVRRYELFGRPRAVYRFDIPDRYAVDIQIGDMVTIVADRFGLDEGKLVVVTGRVEDLERRTTTLTLWG